MKEIIISGLIGGGEDAVVREIGTPYCSEEGKYVFDMTYTLGANQELFRERRFAGDLPICRAGLILSRGRPTGWDPAEQKITVASSSLTFIGYEKTASFSGSLSGNEYCAVYDSPMGVLAIPCTAIPYSFFFAETRIINKILRGSKLEDCVESVGGGLSSLFLSAKFFPGVNISGMSNLTKHLAVLCTCSQDFRFDENLLCSSCASGTPLRMGIPEASSSIMTLEMYGKRSGDVFLASRLDVLRSPLRCANIDVHPPVKARPRPKKSSRTRSNAAQADSDEVLPPSDAGHAGKSTGKSSLVRPQSKMRIPRFITRRTPLPAAEASSAGGFSGGSGYVSTGGSGSGNIDAEQTSIVPGGSVSISVIPGFEAFCSAISELSRLLPYVDISVSGGSSDEVSVRGAAFKYAIAVVKSETKSWRICEFHFENGSQTYTLIIPSKEELSFSKRTLLEIMCKYGEYGSMAKTELMKSYMYAYTLRHSERRSPPRWAARMRARLV